MGWQTKDRHEYAVIGLFPSVHDTTSSATEYYGYTSGVGHCDCLIGDLKFSWQGLNEHFVTSTHFSPLAVSIIPDKPNHCVPSFNPSPDSVSEASSLLNTMSVVKDNDQAPHERYALPVTANMEYGFFSNKPLVPTNPMFDHRTKKVDVTAYGELYVKMAGTGPYNKIG